MNDIEKKVTPEENPEIEAMSDEVIDQTLVQIRPGQIVTGKVVQITDDEVCVNIGYKADGIVKKTDLSSTDVKIDDEIEVEVVKVNDGEGNVLLSQKNIINRKAWEEIVAKQEAGEFVEGVGKEAVKGGLLADVNGIRTFIPASQLDLRSVEKIDKFVGQPMTLKIIEIDPAKKRIVASRKEVLKIQEAEKKQKIWSVLEKGSIVKGVVRRLADFGAFVDIGGVDGLVHVTDLSWGRVKHPSDVVQPGQEIDVKIKNVDPERERISLSYKDTQPKPWTVADQKYPVGSVVEGKVVRITPFGAFVELEPGLDGLVHISQCALTRIAKVEDAVNVGDIVRVKVLDVNTEAERISLSIRQVLEDEGMDYTTDDSALDIPGESLE
jgi:4-hydroxy-3-methylbut-2-enyl diphosphate reductase